MTREGECRHCGKCCFGSLVFKYRGHREDDGRLVVEFGGIEDFAADDFGDKIGCDSCALDEETGRAVCLHEEEKPEICRLYPTTPGEIIFASCGFRFVDGKAAAAEKDLTSAIPAPIN